MCTWPNPHVYMSHWTCGGNDKPRGKLSRNLSSSLPFSSLLVSIPAPLPSSSRHFLFLLPLLLFSTKKEEISAAALLEVGFGVQWTFFSALFCLYIHILSISLMLMFLLFIGDWLHCWSSCGVWCSSCCDRECKRKQERKTSRVWWKVTKHYRSMSLRKSGHRGRVGNPSMPAEEDVKVYIIRICSLKPAVKMSVCPSYSVYFGSRCSNVCWVLISEYWKFWYYEKWYRIERSRLWTGAVCWAFQCLF
jgi:hypothetical protein